MPTSKTYTLSVEITDLRNNKGHIQLDLYVNAQEYEARKGQWTVHVPKKNVKNGKLTFTYSHVKPGVYGIALFDDENANGKLDYGWVMPTEGFGFGDYYHKKWSTPKFDDFKFYLNSDKKVIMKVRYL